MWHSHATWAGLRAETSRAHDNDADTRAMRFAESLEGAVLDLEDGFEHATRKAEHVEELRRVLGILLDVLADWEMAL